MWPTVLNTAVGVRAIPQDYLERRQGAAALAHQDALQSPHPATLPYMFTGFRLSLGIAWLVIVAAEMLTGTPGVGGFLWQEYNSLIYAHIILCILTIGLVGFVLDRLMSLVEAAASRRHRLAWPFSNSSNVSKGYGTRRPAHRGARATSTYDRERRVRRHRRLLRRGQDDADLAHRRLLAPDSGTRHASTVRRSPRPGPIAASSSRTTRCCRG